MRIATILLFTAMASLVSIARAEPRHPTTMGAKDDVAALIARLGNPDFHVRSDASNRLREIGAAALPALKAAQNDKDPEVRARATRLVSRLEFRHVPGRPTNHSHVRTSTVNMTNDADGRSINVDDEGRKISLLENADGIRLTVTGEIDGRPATEVYIAATPDELKSDNAEAFAIYERWARSTGPELAGFQGNIVLQQNGNVIVLPGRPQIRGFNVPGDDLAGVRAHLEDEMVKAGLTPQQKQQVQDALAEVEESRQLNAAAQGDQADVHIRRYDKACDNLRNLLADLKLSDPGEALPPPRGARLGISVQPDGVSGGLSVAHVVPDSRADRIGLQDDDVIQKINGREVTDVKDLRKLVTDHPKGLVLDIIRDGREMKLTEKDRAAGQ